MITGSGGNSLDRGQGPGHATDTPTTTTTTASTTAAASIRETGTGLEADQGTDTAENTSNTVIIVFCTI